MSRHVSVLYRRCRWPSFPPSLLIGAAGVALLTSCSPGSVEASPPSPSGRALASCRALHDALPRTLDGLTSRETDPVSDFTAAWGTPPVVLRCGGPLPDVLRAGDPRYDPTSATVEVNGVQWLPEERADGGYAFTTVGRGATIELRVPGRYHPHQTDALVDLAEVVRKAVPTRL